MSTKVEEQPDVAVTNFLQGELAKDFSQQRAAANASKAVDPKSRLPLKISGGFQRLSDELDQRARDWTQTVKVLDHQRVLLETAETERDRLTEELETITPQVHQTGQTLKSMLDATKGGDISNDLAGHFSKNLEALERLDRIADALSANILWVRSTWEQYARTVIRAQRMREELRTPSADH